MAEKVKQEQSVLVLEAEFSQELSLSSAAVVRVAVDDARESFDIDRIEHFYLGLRDGRVVKLGQIGLLPSLLGRKTRLRYCWTG